MKVGLIGAGGIAARHLQNLHRIEGARLACVCDVDAGRAQAAAQPWGARAYTDFRAMLRGEEMDALLICVPPFAHGEPELLAVERGLPFLVEKPLDVGLEQAERIAEAVAARGLITSAGYMYRYSDTTLRAKEILATRTPGMFLGYYLGGLPGVPWWRVKAQSGGQVVEQATHVADLLRFLGGEVSEVYAASALRALGDVPGLDVDDVGTVTIRFRSGAVGSLSNTCMLTGYWVAGVDVICRDLLLELRHDRLRAVAPDREEAWKARLDPYLVELQVFLRAVQSGDAQHIRSPYADALETQRLTAAIARSAEKKEAIAL